MLGKKKKQEEAPPEQNDLDKPQTLAELDAMAREKKDDKVVLEDGDDPSGEADTNAEHEHTHSDERSAEVDVVKKVTGSQKRLWLLVWFAVIFLVVGGVFFYLQLEDGGEIGVGAGGGPIIEGGTDEESESAIPKGTYAYVAQAGQSQYTRENLEDQSENQIETGASISNARGAFQVSSNSLVSAVDTGSGILVKSLDTEITLLAEQASQVTEWVLIPDGTRIYALVGSALWAADTTSGNTVEVAAGFRPPGGDISSMGYSRGGTVFMYSKSGGLLTGSVFNPTNGEVTEVEKEVIRLSSMGQFQPDSISPDGTSILFFADINGSPTLQLLSLNSFVLRTVYLAESGNRPQSFVWSADSNNVAVYETGVNPLIGNLKVGTLQKEIVQEGVGSATSLAWSPDKKRLAYISAGSLVSLDIESKEITKLIESVKAGSYTGWFQN